MVRDSCYWGLTVKSDSRTTSSQFSFFASAIKESTTEATSFRVCCPAVRLLIPVWRVLLVDGSQWNLAESFVTWVGIAEKVLKVRGQRSKVKDQGHNQTEYFSGGSIISTVWGRGWLVHELERSNTAVMGVW